METNDVLRQKDWSEQELIETGFKYFQRIKYVVLARELPPEEAPLKMKYGNDILVATAGYMICFSAGWWRKGNLYDYHHWPVALDHFEDTYLPWDETTWKPTWAERHLLSLGCKPYYNVGGVWARKLEQPQMIQNPEQDTPFEVPAGAWLILGAKGSEKGVPWWSMDKGFRNRFTSK